MKQKQIRISKREKSPEGLSALSYFRRPLNIILIIVLLAGIIFTVAANSIHPSTVYKNEYSQKYPVSTNISFVSGITIFPNETTHISFSMPVNSALHFYLYGLVPVKVTPSLEAPDGWQIIDMAFAYGNASDGTNLSISNPNVPFPINASMIIYSLSGNNFSMTVDALSESGFVLNFYPPLAIVGLTMATTSMILIATISGVRREEV